MVNILSKFQVSRSNDLEALVFSKFGRKGWFTDQPNHSVSDAGVCRTAAATLGLRGSEKKASLTEERQ